MFRKKSMFLERKYISKASCWPKHCNLMCCWGPTVYSASDPRNSRSTNEHSPFFQKTSFKIVHSIELYNICLAYTRLIISICFLLFIANKQPSELLAHEVTVDAKYSYVISSWPDEPAWTQPRNEHPSRYSLVSAVWAESRARLDAWQRKYISSICKLQISRPVWHIINALADVLPSFFVTNLKCSYTLTHWV